MELAIVNPKKTQNPKKNQNKSAKTTVIVNPGATGGGQSKSARKRARKRARKMGGGQMVPNRSPVGKQGSSGPVGYFMDHIRFPDLLGPFRQPRFGASNRTGLGMIKGRATIVGHATNVVQGVQLLNPFDANVKLTTMLAINENTGFTLGQSTNPSVVFPATTNVADVNLVACDMVATYLSEPTLVTGQLLIGSCIPIVTAATYSSMYDYPTTLRFPIAQLVDEPLRCYGRKISEAANEFLPVSTAFPDVDMPYIITSGLAVGKTMAIDFTLVYEYRSTTAQSLIVPFEKTEYSNSQLMDAFNNATDNLANQPAPVEPGIPAWYERLGESFSYYANRGIQNVKKSGALENIAHFMTNRYLQNLRANSYRPRAYNNYLSFRDEL